jgi:hypothetical protein
LSAAAERQYRQPEEEAAVAASWSVRRLDKLDRREVDELAGVLVDCVEGGALVQRLAHPDEPRPARASRQGVVSVGPECVKGPGRC